MLLDEPTPTPCSLESQNKREKLSCLRNHLDLETIEGLAMALNKFEAQLVYMWALET